MRGVADDALRASEGRLRQAQKMEAVGQLAGGVAHDFNSLLLAIIGHADLALGVLPAGSTAREDVEAVRQVAERAAQLVRQLFGLRPTTGPTPRPIDAATTVREIAPMLARIIGDRGALALDIAEDRCIARADASQLAQVLVTLAAHARDALDGRGGTVTVRVRRQSIDEPRARQMVALGSEGSETRGLRDDRCQRHRRWDRPGYPGGAVRAVSSRPRRSVSAAAGARQCLRDRRAVRGFHLGGGRAGTREHAHGLPSVRRDRGGARPRTTGSRSDSREQRLPRSLSPKMSRLRD